MAKFLTTSGATYHIENIIRHAKSYAILVTPYLKLSQTLTERLKDADSRSIQITLIYGKERLKKEQADFLKTLKNIEVYFCENLHAKCYYNESSLVLSSMNLYETSQNKNREMGVLITTADDEELYNEVITEVESIKRNSVAEQLLKKDKPQPTEQPAITFDRDVFFSLILPALKAKYRYSIVEKAEVESVPTIVVRDFLADGIEVHIDYIVKIQFYERSQKAMALFNKLNERQRDAIVVELNYDRVFWNKKWNRCEISVYPNLIYTEQEKTDHYLAVIDLFAKSMESVK